MSGEDLTPERVYRIAGDLMAQMFIDHSEGAGERWAADPRTRAVADAVYRAGREDAARDIEATFVPGRPIPEWAMPGRTPTAKGIRTWAAQIARGQAGDAGTVTT